MHWEELLYLRRSRSYCVFDGKLAHGVLDSGCASKRVTFLVRGVLGSFLPVLFSDATFYLKL